MHSRNSAGAYSLSVFSWMQRYNCGSSRVKGCRQYLDFGREDNIIPIISFHINCNSMYILSMRDEGMGVKPPVKLSTKTFKWIKLSHIYRSKKQVNIVSQVDKRAIKMCVVKILTASRE